MTDTMKKEDVVFPDSRHAKLGMYTAMRGKVAQLIPLKVEGRTSSVNWSEADKVMKDILEHRDEYKDAYWKIGFIGKNLVLRVKAEKLEADMLSKLFKRKDYTDVVLLTNCGPKVSVASGSEKPKSDTLKFPSYFVLTQDECPKILQEHLDIGKGFTLQLTISIPGTADNAGLKARIKDVQKDMCEEYRQRCNDIAKGLSKDLDKIDSNDKKAVLAIAARAEKEFSALLKEDVAAREFQTRVEKMVAADRLLKDRYTEWQFKTACKTVVSSVKLTAIILRLIASHGAEVTAYLDLVKTAYDFYKIIDDFTKTEADALKELEVSLQDYQNAATSMQNMMKGVYNRYNVSHGSTFKEIKATFGAASEAAEGIQSVFDQELRKTKLKDWMLDPPPVQKLDRYLVALGQLVAKLDKQYKQLEKDWNELRGARLNQAVKLWPKVQALKSNCDDALKHFKAQKAYAEAVKKQLEEWELPYTDKTSLGKITDFASGLRRTDLRKIKAGINDTRDAASAVKSAADSIKDLIKSASALA